MVYSIYLYDDIILFDLFLRLTNQYTYPVYCRLLIRITIAALTVQPSDSHPSKQK